MKMADVGVLVERAEAEKRWKYGLNVFEYYLYEILDDAGIPYRKFDNEKEAASSAVDILVVGLEQDDAETAALLWDFVKSGGTVISYGGLHKLCRKLGCAMGRMSGPGYAELPEYGQEHCLRYLKALPWVSSSGNELAEQRIGNLFDGQPAGSSTGSALLRFRVGLGTIERWSVNIMETIIGLQQGLAPVLADGIPAPDGTAAIDEGILKADDGIALDWRWDRKTTETGQPYFAVPYADLWREVLVSHLLRTAVGLGRVLPFIDDWPAGVDAAAMISHDSDLNVDASAERTLELLECCRIRTTWCMMEPGFSPQYYARIERQGHELAFHYNALPADNGHWGEAEFSRQLQWLRDAAGIRRVASNKNHYTRYEGWGELFDWCEKEGIASDQTFGPSKKGNVGFLFGTCRPFFPIAWWNRRNRTYDVTEICFQSQDLDIGVWADSSLIPPLLAQVKRVRGVAHVLFHQYHLYTKPSAADAMLRFVIAAREAGLEFWTGRQINDWVRSRRSVRITGLDQEGNAIFAPAAVPQGLTAWAPVLTGEAAAAMRYGVPCRKA
jgi:hypothetical protein